MHDVFVFCVFVFVCFVFVRVFVCFFIVFYFRLYVNYGVVVSKTKNDSSQGR